jgi:hypothetical protein
MSSPRAALALALASLPLAGGPAAADKGAFGLGVLVGEPVGLSARQYLADDMAVQAGLGAALVGGGLQVHADVVWHPWILEDREGFTLPVYVGPGLRFVAYERAGGEDSVAVGLRGVVGVVFDFKRLPLDVFLEAALVGEYELGGAPEADGPGLALNVGAGVRYYF